MDAQARAATARHEQYPQSSVTNQPNQEISPVHIAVVVVLMLVSMAIGYGVRVLQTRKQAVPRRHPSPRDVAPVAPTFVERADSPFVMCRFQTKDGVVVAEKRLRRESITTPMLWGATPYRRIAHDAANTRFTFERE